MDADSTKSSSRPDRLATILIIGPILLFLGATAYGILEVHSSTDTWIGLAAGRQIYTADRFPTTDTFSYTFNGRPWYNQNWLTHLLQYWLYRNIAPNAVVYGTWMLSSSVFVLVLLAAYWRSGTWLGALLAGAVVGLGCRDFLSARPATTGFFCIAALWALLCALEGQRDTRRRWPVVLLLPLLLFWGNAHGSFVFGYGVLGLYLGHWFVLRMVRVKDLRWLSLWPPLLVILIAGVLFSIVPPGATTDPEDLLTIRATAYSKKKLALVSAALLAFAVYWICIRLAQPRVVLSDRQAAAVGGVAVLAAILTVLFGPFGIENFTHVLKIAGSEVFRQVSEWRPPYVQGRFFPPVWRFWTVLSVSLGMLLSCAVLFLLLRTKARAAPPGLKLHTSIFDVAVVAIGLFMTLSARRFAPIYFIFGAPVFLTWIVLLLRPLAEPWRPYLRLAVMAGAGLFASAVFAEAGKKAHLEFHQDFEKQPGFDLLQRVTRYDFTPHHAILFLRNNQLHVNLLVEWTQAGPVMFYAPNAKVFMDGRAQQLYDERHYRQYTGLLVSADSPRPRLMRILAEHDTNAVLLRRHGRARNLVMALEQSGQWVPVLLDTRYGLFLRKNSPGLAQLGRALRAGKEWRPNTPSALATRGLVWKTTRPPDLERALADWNAAVHQDVRTGTFAFPPLVRTLLELGRTDEARRLVEGYYQRLSRPVVGLSERARQELLRTLRACWADIEDATPADRADDAEG